MCLVIPFMVSFQRLDYFYLWTGVEYLTKHGVGLRIFASFPHFAPHSQACFICDALVMHLCHLYPDRMCIKNNSCPAQLRRVSLAKYESPPKADVSHSSHLPTLHHLLLPLHAFLVAFPTL